MENTAIYGLVVAAVIIAILINWRLKINLGLACVVFAYIIGCIILNMKASDVVAMTPVKIVFQLAAITMFFPFRIKTGRWRRWPITSSTAAAEPLGACLWPCFSSERCWALWAPPTL